MNKLDLFENRYVNFDFMKENRYIDFDFMKALDRMAIKFLKTVDKRIILYIYNILHKHKDKLMIEDSFFTKMSEVLNDI